jgi:cell division protein FtsB
VPDAKRPDPKRRSPGTRPGRSDAGRGRPRASAPRRERQSEARESEPVTESITESVAATIARQSEQRLGMTARRAAILAAVVCVLTLTIAGPVRTYFAQRTEMKQLAAEEAEKRSQIKQLEEMKVKLADPAYIESQARERLGFVMPGETPYQVQLPPGAVESSGEPGGSSPSTASGDPWYTALWRTIADTPHNIAPPQPGPGVGSLPSPVPPPAAPPSPGG